MDWEKELPFAVEVLDGPGSPVICTVARTADALSAMGAYEGALKVWPMKNVALRLGAHVIAASWRPIDEDSPSGVEIGDVTEATDGWGFGVWANDGRMLLCTVYPTEDQAVSAAAALQTILADATAVFASEPET